MKSKFLLTALCVLVLTCLPAHATNCNDGRPSSNSYIRRDNNRCEGTMRREGNITGDIDLISLTSSHGGTLGSTLMIEIPKISSNQPTVKITEPDINYRLDDLSFASSGQFYRFELPTTVLQRLGITSLNPLRGLAKKGGNQRVYLPVIFNTPAPKYRFVFYSSRQSSFQKAEIRKDGRALISWGVQGRKQGEKIFEWAPGSSPAGRYTFYFEANIYQRSGSPQTIERNIIFDHNPAWLR